jgi:hypothetical protein
MTTNLPSIPGNIRKYCLIIDEDDTPGIKRSLVSFLGTSMEKHFENSIMAQKIVRENYSKKVTLLKIQNCISNESVVD